MASIQEIMRLSDPLKSYQWRVTVANAVGIGASGELLQFRCTSSVLPGRTIDQIVTSLDNYDVSDAGRMAGPLTWTTTFIEGTDVQVINRMEAWQNIIHDPETGVQASRDEYKRVVTIELLNNAKDVVLTRTLHGCWPQAVADLALDKSSSEALQLEVTWSYDYHTSQ